jgi:hypothetical protein
VEVEYRYAHQEGVGETGTKVRIYLGKDGEEFRLLDSGTDQTVFYLPASLSGEILLSVTPSTARKTGGEYFGQPVPIPAAP